MVKFKIGLCSILMLIILMTGVTVFAEQLPTVTTVSATNTQNSVKFTGNLTSLGSLTEVAEHGFLWSTTPNVDLFENAPGSKGLGKKTSTGTFTWIQTGLTPGTKYYVRAIAVYGAAADIVYGKEISFTTNSAPTIILSSPNSGASLTAGSAISLSGTVRDLDSGQTLYITYQIDSKAGQVLPIIIANGSNQSFSGSIPSSYTTGLSKGNHTLYVNVIDSAGGSGTRIARTITITVPPTVTTVSATNTQNSVKFTGDLISLGSLTEAAEHGFLWSTTPNVDLFENAPGSKGLGKKTSTGTFTWIQTGLTPGTKYYVRAIAVYGAASDIVYGKEISFTTASSTVAVARVEAAPNSMTVAASGTTFTAAAVVLPTNAANTNITWSNNGYSWISIAQPISDTNPGSSGTSITVAPNDSTSSRTGTATVKTSDGGKTATIRITQSGIVLPTITTVSATDISPTSVKFTGDLTSLGSLTEVAEHGFLWSTTPNVDLFENAPGSKGLGKKTSTGTFTWTQTDLTPGTKYYVRAIAVYDAAADIVYGKEISFTTKSSNSAPTIILSSPSDGASLTAGSAISLSGTVRDLDGGQTLYITYQIDSKAAEALMNITANGSSQRFSGSIPGSYTAGLSEYNHKLYVNVSDSAGGAGTRIFRTIKITSSNTSDDTSGPEITVSPDGGTVNGKGPITISATDTSKIKEISWELKNGNYFKNGSYNVNTNNAKTTDSKTIELDSDAPYGVYTATFTAVDTLGNTSQKVLSFTFVETTVAVTGVKLKSSTTMNVNATEQLTAEIEPATATNQNITWDSDNPAVATVSASGLITAKAVGTARIKATASSNTSISATCTVTVSQSNQTSSFSDVPANHWAYKAITAMAKDGIINGFTDGTFKPNDVVTREQFAKMMVLTLNLPIIEPQVPTFADVNSTSWSYKFIESAKQYLTGYEKDNVNYYKPSDSAVRQDMAYALVKAKGLENETVDVSRLQTIFADANKISSVLAKYVLIAYDKNMISGYLVEGVPDRIFQPKGTLTRAEAAQLLYNAAIVSSNESGEVIILP